MQKKSKHSEKFEIERERRRGGEKERRRGGR